MWNVAGTIVTMLLSMATVIGLQLEPIRLQAGNNQVRNIAGDGTNGSISLDWRDNGNAWGYSIYVIRVGSSIATIEGRDRITDQPHADDDAITSVRFARGIFQRRLTTFALIANREIVENVPSPAQTTIKIYALVRNQEQIGTPYSFVLANQPSVKRRYCNAEMALQTEIGFPLRRNYSGLRTVDGC